MSPFLLLFRFHCIISLFAVVRGQFSQSDQPPYLANFNSIDEASYSAVNDPLNENVPSQLLESCAKGNTPIPQSENIVTVESSSSDLIIKASQVASQCSSLDTCVIPSSLTMEMDVSIQVAALRIEGNVIWTLDSQQIDSMYLCAGYIAIEGSNANWNMDLSTPAGNSNTKYGWIYIMNNGMVHSVLRSRAFGAVGGSMFMKGNTVERTWSLLSRELEVGSNQMELLHNPVLMGWNVGDRIAIAPTEKSSEGYAQEFFIQDIDEFGIVTLDRTSQYRFKAEFHTHGLDENKNVATKSAEVVLLSRNVIVTGDDFEHVDAVDGLVEAIPGEQTSSDGCMRNSFRTKCTYGLHMAQMFQGTQKIENVRIEKCGQRGVEGKYCLHLHKLGNCSDCLFKNNAIENSHQRGIIVHGTHNSVVDDNILYNVRGANVYIEDGNEMHNKIRYNVVICPFPFKHPQLGGCTIPGTSNRIADTSDNQSGFYSRAATNDMIGNRAANTFNGMFWQALGSGRGDFAGKVCEADAKFGRFIGNVFHGHLRFGTYSLGNNYPKETDQSVESNGINTDNSLCQGFNDMGETRGYAGVFLHHQDYDSVFVGHYNAGDLQYDGHYSSGNNNLMYWKESKVMEDGCSPHLYGGHYEQGNVALPDQATFIIEETSFTEATLEANHHCGVGVTGVLCQPQYILHNVSFRKSGDNWLYFSKHNRDDHTYIQADGGIFSLSPPNANEVMAGGVLQDSIFPDGFVSIVSSKFSYLLDHPDDVCSNSSSMGADIQSRYGDTILCKVPLRSLKIYTRYLRTYMSPADMKVEARFGSSGTEPDAIQFLRYHQSGPDQFENKQGYSLPVIPGVENKYRLSLRNGEDIPNDWIIEFNDPIVANRWEEEFITLEVNGRECANNGLVSSRHDRKFIWSGDEFLNPAVWDSNDNAVHGACSLSQQSNMPSKVCPSKKSIGPLECPLQCENGCSENAYCDCGTSKCLCKPGFHGDDCEIDLCSAARCSPNAACVAKYLGTGTSGILPVTSSNACICDDGYSGITCGSNPCDGVSCNGNGTCKAVGSNAVCECNDGYSGNNCETSCDDFCIGTFPYNCNPNLGEDVVKYACKKDGGCTYPTDPSTKLDPSQWCVFKENVSNDVCVCSSSNQCQRILACNEDSTCPDPEILEDGSVCHSEPWGTCENGKCIGSTQLSPTDSPSTLPSVSPSELNRLTSFPSTSPSVPCTEDSSAIFLKGIKVDDVGKQVAQQKTCSWLSGKKPKKIRRICNKSVTFGNLQPANILCPITCKKCFPCEESFGSKFFLKTKIKATGEVKDIFRSCEWLVGKPSKLEKICSKTESKDGIGPANEVCVLTCNSCGWK